MMYHTDTYRRANEIASGRYDFTPCLTQARPDVVWYDSHALSPHDADILSTE